MDTLLSDPRFHAFYVKEKAEHLAQFGEAEDRLTVAVDAETYDLLSSIAAAQHKSLEETVKVFLMGGAERVAVKPERKLVQVDAETYDLVQTFGAALRASPDAITRELIMEGIGELAEELELEQEESADKPKE